MTFFRLTGRLRPLASRNYRLYFIGQIVSLVGTLMSETAAMWLVYQWTGSERMLGVAGFMSLIPMFFLAPLAGVWVDRWNRHRMILVLQWLFLLTSIALALIASSPDHPTGWIIGILGLRGALKAFDLPARQSFINELIDDPQELPRALALNASMFHTARFVGPALGGTVAAYFGAKFCFSIDAISYLAVIAGFIAMRVTPRASTLSEHHPLHDFTEGIRYAWKHPQISSQLFALSCSSFFTFSGLVLLPVFAREHFHGGAELLGFFQSASAVGAIAGSIYLGSGLSSSQLRRATGLGGILQGSSLIFFSLCPNRVAAIFCLVFSGVGGVLVTLGANMRLQQLTDPTKRGRILSLHNAAFAGTVPIGNLLVGLIAHQVGAALTLTAGASLGIFGSLFLLRRDLEADRTSPS